MTEPAEIIATATRATMTDARRHFLAGGRVIVHESDRGPSVPVTAISTTHAGDRADWNALAADVKAWRNRYPRQTFYVIPEPEPAESIRADLSRARATLNRAGRTAASAHDNATDDATRDFYASVIDEVHTLWRRVCDLGERFGEPEPDFYALASRDASLGVGHVWTNTRCPAYRSYDPSDCECNG